MRNLRLLPLLALSACASAPRAPAGPRTPPPGDDLLSAADLGAWSARDGGPPGEWMVAGDVALDREDERRLRPAPGTGVLINGRGKTVDLFSRRRHGDAEVRLEFLIPRGSNSGVYLQGRYEVQIYDSHGVAAPRHSDCGGIYQRWAEAERRGFEGHPPRVNACRPPGEWQSLLIVFRAPRFDASGQKVANARFERVVLNGAIVHEGVEVTGPTRASAWDDEQPEGPLMLQGDHGPVAYRNVRLRPLPP